MIFFIERLRSLDLFIDANDKAVNPLPRAARVDKCSEERVIAR